MIGETKLQSLASFGNSRCAFWLTLAESLTEGPRRAEPNFWQRSESATF